MRYLLRYAGMLVWNHVLVAVRSERSPELHPFSSGRTAHSGLVEALMLDTSSSAGICCPDHISTLIQDATAVFSCIDSLDARIGPSTDMLNVRCQMFCARRAIAS